MSAAVVAAGFAASVAGAAMSIDPRARRLAPWVWLLGVALALRGAGVAP